MIYVNVILTVQRDSDVAIVRDLLATQAELSKAEPGCARFEVYHSQTDRAVFILAEHWQTQEHLDNHRRGRAFREIYQPKVLPLVERVPHPADLVA